MYDMQLSYARITRISVGSNQGLMIPLMLLSGDRSHALHTFLEQGIVTPKTVFFNSQADISTSLRSLAVSDLRITLCGRHIPE